MATAVTTLEQPQGQSVTADMATRFGMDPRAFEATVRATCMPAGKEQSVSREQFAAFLLVAKEYNLNPLTKEIYAFPTRSGGIQPVVGVDGWANLINSHPQCDGVEFEDHIEGTGVTAITARIWRKDRAHPTTVTEYLSECRRATDTWKQWPRRMLRHKALIQCARYAFGFSGIVDPDEAERIAGPPNASQPTRQVREIVSPPPVPKTIAAPRPAPTAAHWDQDTGEVWDDPNLPDLPADEMGATADDVFDPAQWLKDLDGAFAGCEDMASLSEAQAKYMTAHIEKALPPDRRKAKQILDGHLARITRDNEG